MPINKPYASNRLRTPKLKKEKRIVMPTAPTRPLKFQARSLIRMEYVRPSAWWMTIHRRGPHRPDVGQDVLEQRAVPKNIVRGTLPERIIYKALIQHLHMVPGFDFMFQPSFQGGRMELGGIVADFTFPVLRIVVQVQGPTHKGFLRIRKDKEQELALAEMGYSIVAIEEEIIYNIFRFEEWLRDTFTAAHFGNVKVRSNIPDKKSPPRTPRGDVGDGSDHLKTMADKEDTAKYPRDYYGNDNLDEFFPDNPYEDDVPDSLTIREERLDEFLNRYY